MPERIVVFGDRNGIALDVDDLRVLAHNSLKMTNQNI
jgi:hypothetical protein